MQHGAHKHAVVLYLHDVNDVPCESFSERTKNQFYLPISLQLNQSKEEVDMIKMYQRKAQDIKKKSVKNAHNFIVVHEGHKILIGFLEFAFLHAYKKKM